MRTPNQRFAVARLMRPSQLWAAFFLVVCRQLQLQLKLWAETAILCLNHVGSVWAVIFSSGAVAADGVLALTAGGGAVRPSAGGGANVYGRIIALIEVASLTPVVAAVYVLTIARKFLVGFLRVPLRRRGVRCAPRVGQNGGRRRSRGVASGLVSNARGLHLSGSCSFFSIYLSLPLHFPYIYVYLYFFFSFFASLT